TGTERWRARARRASRPRATADSHRRFGPPSLRRVAAGKKGDRHRRLLRRLDTHRAHARLGAADDARRRAATVDRVLSPAFRSLCAGGRRRSRVVTDSAGSQQARVAFLDLRPREDADVVRGAVARVMARGWYILGPEVAAFESEFAAASGSQFAVGTGNGTDAISLLLRAAGIGRDDEVIVPAITAAYTALAVLAAGAQPVIVDVDDETLTMDPAACAAAITARTRAIVPVHLYGQAADMSALTALAAQR